MPRTTKNNPRSPLKAPPLRNPGQSIDEEIQRIVGDDLPIYFFFVGAMLLLTLMEWSRWYFQTPPLPLPFTAVTLPILAFVGWKLVQFRRKVRLLRQARDGERAVGQYLEALRERGYRVLHDLVGDGFNVDHVLIGPAGVFAIETKTISKPAKGPAEILYDGSKVVIGGFTPDRDPVVQGKAQAGWLRELLQESTGHQYNIRSIVVYPGWFVKNESEAGKSQVLVLNPKILPAFLEKCPAHLGMEDVKLITYHLSRYIRTSV